MDIITQAPDSEWLMQCNVSRAFFELAKHHIWLRHCYKIFSSLLSRKQNNTVITIRKARHIIQPNRRQHMRGSWWKWRRGGESQDLLVESVRYKRGATHDDSKARVFYVEHVGMWSYWIMTRFWSVGERHIKAWGTPRSSVTHRPISMPKPLTQW
jgi:hypothetical protein